MEIHFWRFAGGFKFYWTIEEFLRLFGFVDFYHARAFQSTTFFSLFTRISSLFFPSMRLAEFYSHHFFFFFASFPYFLFAVGMLFNLFSTNSFINSAIQAAKNEHDTTTTTNNRMEKKTWMTQKFIIWRASRRRDYVRFFGISRNTWKMEKKKKYCRMKDVIRTHRRRAVEQPIYFQNSR